MIRLHSECLFDKFGFSDGDVLDDVLQEAEIDTAVSHKVLIYLVREKLLPALPVDVEVYSVSTIHNPIRASNEEAEEGVKGFYVDVEESEIIEIARMLE